MEIHKQSNNVGKESLRIFVFFLSLSLSLSIYVKNNIDCLDRIEMRSCCGIVIFQNKKYRFE